MDPRVSRFGSPLSGRRGAIVLGLALALVGAGVGTATGAVTPFQLVVIKNTAAEPVPVVGTVNIGNTPSNQDVTVTNLPSTQPVSGTVDVGNFPGYPLATVRISGSITTGPFGGTGSISIPNMRVTTVIVADGDEDNYDIGIGGFKLVIDHEGNFIEHFPAAFGASGSVVITCENPIDECDVSVTVLGF